MTPPAETRICAKCNETIEGGVLIALNREYHPEHFLCTECEQPIETKEFQQKNNEPFCAECYAFKFLKKCKACNEPIRDKAVSALGGVYHEDHFVCDGCKSKLIGTQFMDLNGTPICQKCYKEKYADKCKACGKPITAQAVIALDSKWHQLCFKCYKCEKPIIKDQSYKLDGGKPACVKC